MYLARLQYSLSLFAIKKPQNADPLHHAGGRVTQKLASRLQCTVDPYLVIGDHEEVAGFRRVMRGLLGDVVAPRLVWVVPVARIRLAQNRIQGLFNATGGVSLSSANRTTYGGFMCQPVM